MISSLEIMKPIERIIFEMLNGLNGYRQHSKAEICSILGIHYRKVEAHINSITSKLGAATPLDEQYRNEYSRHLKIREGFDGEYRVPRVGFLTQQDRVVVVLGNGASISEVKEYCENDQPPPTDNDFLKVASKLKGYKYRKLEMLYDELWSNCAPYPMKYQRMEQLFASSFLKVLQDKGNTKKGMLARVFYDSLIDLLRDTLSETTAKYNAPQHQKLFAYIRRVNPISFDIVSFNYDVLAERALLKGNKKKLWSWNCRDGYGFKPENHYSPKEPSNITIYKLHGSMNWYIPLRGKRRRTAYDTKAPIYIPNPLAAEDSPVWQRKQYRMGNRNLSVFPLIVPPVFEKGSLINDSLQKVWDNASEVLEKATIVIIWGYSMPTTDYHSEVLFARCARSSKSKLVCINPCNNALSRITSVAGHNWTRWFFRVGHLFNVFNGELE